MHLDPDFGLGERYTAEVNRSEKMVTEGGAWQHEGVALSPHSDHGGHEANAAGAGDEGRMRVVAELVALLGES